MEKTISQPLKKISIVAKLFLFFSVFPLIVSCSMLKRKCEKTNWFEYGKGVALTGKRLSADEFYNQCIEKEAEINEVSADQGFKQGLDIYCAPEAPYDYGKLGKPYNFKFCDHINISEMKSLHMKGLRVYCQPSNGYPEGIKGEAYNKLCPCLLYTSPSPRDRTRSRMPSSA